MIRTIIFDKLQSDGIGVVNVKRPIICRTID
jgi:hypothetical protein